MAICEKTICIYVPLELFEAIDDAAYRKGMPRSIYIKELILNHLSEGNENKRMKLLGREKERRK